MVFSFSFYTLFSRLSCRLEGGADSSCARPTSTAAGTLFWWGKGRPRASRVALNLSVISYTRKLTFAATRGRLLGVVDFPISLFRIGEVLDFLVKIVLGGMLVDINPQATVLIQLLVKLIPCPLALLVPLVDVNRAIFPALGYLLDAPSAESKVEDVFNLFVCHVVLHNA